VALLLVLTHGEPAAVRRRTPSNGKTLPYICDLEVGKGTQVKGDPTWVLTLRRGQTCMDACQRVKRRRKNIIGVATWETNRPDTQEGRERRCACLKSDDGGFTVDASNKDWKTCMFYQEGEPKPQMTYIEKTPVCKGLGTAFFREGCYSFSKRGRYLVNRRYDIQWAKSKHSKFACDFVQECAKAAAKEGVMFFATHFWGECWEVQIADGTAVPSGEGCSLADGLYQNQCVGTDLSHECLGSTNYYVYSIAVPRNDDIQVSKDDEEQKDELWEDTDEQAFF